LFSFGWPGRGCRRGGGRMRVKIFVAGRKPRVRGEEWKGKKGSKPGVEGKKKVAFKI